jgi:hypothetical protein
MIDSPQGHQYRGCLLLGLRLWDRFRNLVVPTGSTWDVHASIQTEAEARRYGGGHFGHWPFREGDRARQDEDDRKCGRSPHSPTALEAARQKAAAADQEIAAKARAEALARYAGTREQRREAYSQSLSRGRSR